MFTLRTGGIAALMMALMLSSPVDALAKRKKQFVADLGIGPAAHFVTGPIQDAQLVHSGLALNVSGSSPPNCSTPKAQNLPAKPAQFGRNPGIPFWYVPKTLFISPKVEGSQMYGVQFEPFGLGLESKSFRLGAGVGLRSATYAYVQSDDVIGGKATFLRPGIRAGIDLEILSLKPSAFLRVGTVGCMFLRVGGSGSA